MLCLYNGCYSVIMSKCLQEMSALGFFLLLTYQLYSEIECPCKKYVKAVLIYIVLIIEKGVVNGTFKTVRRRDEFFLASLICFDFSSNVRLRLHFQSQDVQIELILSRKIKLTKWYCKTF